MARRKAEKRPAPTNFKVGDKVRVRHGVTDVEYPDMPLGGWAGTIHEIHDDGMYTVRWSRETLANIHPVFKKRCERDGMVLEEYWLGDDDLESDDGSPLDIEHPKEIATKPLSHKDRDDRVRTVFGLTSNDPLPDVDDETLETYHKYLSKNLALPFEADRTVETGPFSSRTIQVKVIGLGDPDEPMIDDTYGILCEARHERNVVTLPLGELEVKKGNPVRAGEVRTPEEASHCSVSFRVRAHLATRGGKTPEDAAADDWLAPLTLAPDQLGDMPSANGRRASDKGLLPMTFDEYLKLLDWCGRELRAGKRGAIPADLAPLVERLGIVAEELVDTLDQFPQRFRRLAGTVTQFRKRAAEAGRCWFQGVGSAASVFR